MKQYKTVAFGPLVGKKGRSAADAVAVFANAIEQEGAGGWDLISVEYVPVQLKSGCLASLLGRPYFYEQAMVLTFAKECGDTTEQPIPLITKGVDDTLPAPGVGRVLVPILAAVAVLIVVAVAGVLLWRKAPAATDPSSGSQGSASSSEITEGVMPDLTGIHKDNTDAIAEKLKSAGLSQVKIQFTREYNSTYAEGVIIRQEPSPGTTVINDGSSEVTLCYSMGPKKAVVPDVTGRDLEEAKHVLHGINGFQCREVREYSSEYAANFVIRTDPPAGAEVPYGQTITIYVSVGPRRISVPDVKCLSESQARAMLLEAGLTVSPEVIPVYFEVSDEPVIYEVEVGGVVRTVPEAETVCAEGTEVQLYVRRE